MFFTYVIHRFEFPKSNHDSSSCLMFVHIEDWTSMKIHWKSNDDHDILDNVLKETWHVLSTKPEIWRLEPAKKVSLFGNHDFQVSSHELSEVYLISTSHPGCQSPPGLWTIFNWQSQTKPSFVTGILCGGGRPKVYQTLKKSSSKSTKGPTNHQPSDQICRTAKGLVWGESSLPILSHWLGPGVSRGGWKMVVLSSYHVAPVKSHTKTLEKHRKKHTKMVFSEFWC